MKRHIINFIFSAGFYREAVSNDSAIADGSVAVGEVLSAIVDRRKKSRAIV